MVALSRHSYKGRSGMIEVDGGSHRGCWSNGKSRDRLFEDAGVAYVDHIDADDVKNDADVDIFIGRFLRRLEG
jgi:hypothetical protein